MNRLTAKLVNMQVIVLALILGLVGLVMIWVGIVLDRPPDQRYIAYLGILLQQLGSGLFVIAAITLFWDLFVKRSFLDEVLEKAKLSRDVMTWGITKITYSFYQDIDWRSLIGKSSKIDIFFAYGRTWRGLHDKYLREAARKSGVQMRVVLPDPEDNTTITELARRFGYSNEEVKARIKEAAEHFNNIRAEQFSEGIKISVWFLPVAPVFSFYRFDNVGILALNKHQKGRGDVPTFVCDQGGLLYDFICKEFEAMVASKSGLARRTL